MIWNAKKSGLPVNVYRLGHIVGDAETGNCNTNDFIFRIAKSILKICAYPKIYGSISPIAINEAASSIVGISLDTNNIGKAYHIVNMEKTTFEDLIEIAAKKGISLEPMERGEWVKEIECLGSDSPIYPF